MEHTTTQTKMPNTEKPTGKTEMKKNLAVAPTKIDKKQMEKAPVKEDKKVAEEKNETKKPEVSEQVQDSSSKNRERKKIQKKIKRDFAIVNGPSMHISTKYAMAICKFIKKKNIDKAISDIEDVLVMKKSVPMKGEIPHRKGPGKTGSGARRYPINAAKVFLMLLKSLKANANANDIENPIVTEAYANQASRPMGRFGKWQRKRTHVFIKATEKKMEEKK